MADCMQFLWENRLNGCHIFGRFGFQNRTEQKFGFLHIPSSQSTFLSRISYAYARLSRRRSVRLPSANHKPVQFRQHEHRTMPMSLHTYRQARKQTLPPSGLSWYYFALVCKNNASLGSLVVYLAGCQCYATLVPC